MKSRRSSKLYRRIMACFLSMVLFVCCVQAFAYRYAVSQNEKTFRARVDENLVSINERVSASVFSLFDLSAMVCSNALVQENLRPYDELTAAQLYYYGAILSLLSQTRLQYIDLVDSVFLYADTHRVLYSSNEKGMVGSDTFFGSLMHYERCDQAFWTSLLSSPKAGYSILEPDRYATTKVGDRRTVIPVVYVVSNLGNPGVLVINLSVERLGQLFTDNAVVSGARAAIYAEDGALLCGPDFAPDTLPAGDKARLNGEEYFIASVRQPMLRLNAVSFTPARAYLDMTGYYRVTMLSLLAALSVFGLLLAVFMSRRVYEPFEKVRQDISGIQGLKGDNSYYADELASIRGSLSALVDDREQARRQNRQHSLHYVSQSFANMLDGRRVTDESYFRRLLESDHGFTAPKYRCVDILLDTYGAGDYRTVNPLMAELSDTVARALEDASLCYVRVHYQWNMLVLIINSPGGDAQRVEQACRAVLNKAGAEATYSLRIGIGGEADELHGVTESFHQANSAVLGMPPDAAGEMRVWRGESQGAPFEYDRRSVVAAVNSRNIKNVEEAVEEELSAVRGAGVYYPEAAGIVRDIYRTAVLAQEKTQPGQPMVSPPREDEISPLEVLLLSPGVNVSPIIAALLRRARYDAEKPEKGNEELALRAKAYVDENYMRELSLDIISESLNVTAKYLSRVFKQAMGVNLTDYLAYVRVERVKELLPTGLSLERVAESVGITNRTTFIRTFRKVEGMTPSEYRALHG